jgi:hypothetical protein
MIAPWFVIYNPSCWGLIPIEVRFIAQPGKPVSLQLCSTPGLMRIGGDGVGRGGLKAAGPDRGFF